jgi:predicted nucleic acid-binding protein
MLVWWGTEIECTSAIARLEREGALERAGVVRSLSRLSALAESWHEIQPGAAVRIAALRVLRVHPLRTADALQLASAVIAAEGKPDSLPMVTLDDRLGSAAEREGFVVFGPATAS